MKGKHVPSCQTGPTTWIFAASATSTGSGGLPGGGQGAAARGRRPRTPQRVLGCCVSSVVAPLLRSFRTEACASLLGRAHSCAASVGAVQAGDPAPLLALPPRQLCLPLPAVFAATLNACPSSSQLIQQFSEMGLCRLRLFSGRVRGQQLLGRQCCGQRAGSLDDPKFSASAMMG